MSSSNLLDKMIEALQVMPGIGPVSATRIAYYLLDRKREEGLSMVEAISTALKNVALCPQCHNYTDEENKLCALCESSKRKASKALCVVETPSDVVAIEASASFNGTYFVLHGHLSPLDGVGPNELHLNDLDDLIKKAEIEEVILATSHTVESDVTASYIANMVKKHQIKVTRIATGVPLGGELGSVDGNTLALSLNYRRDM